MMVVKDYDLRVCTCHPADNPPVPCTKQYAYTECIKMTQHDPDVKALLVEVKRTVDYAASFVDHGQDVFAALNAALAKLEPKPEKVYVLPEWERRTENQIIWCRNENVSHDAWIQLRYFTTTDAPAQKWNMPKWIDVPKDSNGWFDFTSENGITNHCGEQAYNAFCAKIMTTNEVKD